MGKGQENILKIYTLSLFYKQRSDLTTCLGAQIFNGGSLLLRACTDIKKKVWPFAQILILMNFENPMVPLNFSVHNN